MTLGRHSLSHDVIVTGIARVGIGARVSGNTTLAMTRADRGVLREAVACDVCDAQRKTGCTIGDDALWRWVFERAAP